MPLLPRDARRGNPRSARAACPSARSAGRGSAGRSCGRSSAAACGKSCAAMSARVAASAVAVSATTGTPPSALAGAWRGRGIRAGNRGPIARCSAPRRWRAAANPGAPEARGEAIDWRGARARRRGGGARRSRACPRPRRRSARIERRRRDPEAPHLLDLVAHQRDQRRDDQRQPAVDDRRKLVAERLAASGRHHREDILAGKHGGDDLGLAGTEGVVAEDGLEGCRRRRHVWRGHRPAPPATPHGAIGHGQHFAPHRRAGRRPRRRCRS